MYSMVSWRGATNTAPGIKKPFFPWLCRLGWKAPNLIISVYHTQQTYPGIVQLPILVPLGVEGDNLIDFVRGTGQYSLVLF
jgi:hypothetical protein